MSFQFFKPDSVLNSFGGSVCGGCVVVACMTPFDVVSTRLYNQPVDSSGRGTIYHNLGDCFVKIFRSEGLWGFYKGWGPSFFRLVPHTILSLVFWDQLRIMHSQWTNTEDESLSVWYSLRANYFWTVVLRATHMEFSIARLKFK